MATSQYYTTTSNTGFNAALKEFYLPRLVSTINERRVLMTRLERDSSKTDVSGRHARLPVNITGTQAIAARADADGGPSLPTPQSQTFVELQIGYAFNYGTIRITHPVIQASKNDRGAFIRAIGAEMDGIRRDLKNDVNRQLFGDGTGALARVNGAEVGGDNTLTVHAGHKVKKNMVIDVYDGASAEFTSRSVTSTTATTVVFDGSAATWADNATVYRAGNKDNEMMGLYGIVDDDNTIQAINRSTYPEWGSIVYSNSGAQRAISEDLLDAGILEAQSQNEADISLMITSPTQFRKIGQLLTDQRRYTPDMELDGGFTAINWAGIPIVWDIDCPRNGQFLSDQTNDCDMLFGIDESQLAIYQLADWDFDETDGNILHRRQDVAAYDATLFYYANLGVLDGSNHFVIQDLQR